jgi:hypothetical protein
LHNCWACSSTKNDQVSRYQFKILIRYQIHYPKQLRDPSQSIHELYDYLKPYSDTRWWIQS